MKYLVSAVLVLVACLAVFLIGFGETPVPQAVGSDLPAGDDPVANHVESTQWDRRSSSDGSLRLHQKLGEAGSSDGQLTVGLGPLSGTELEIPRQVFDLVVSKARRRLQGVYTSDHASSVSSLRHEEARLARELRKMEAFASHFEQGKYFVVEDVNDSPPLAEGHIGYNVGVTRSGKSATLVVVVDTKTSGLEDMDRAVEEARMAWLQEVVYHFNSKVDEERRRLVDMFLGSDESGKRAVASNFPDGVTIDAVRATIHLK